MAAASLTPVTRERHYDMSKLDIGGIVRYSDLSTPVIGAQVDILDLDLGGNGNDVIFSKKTNQNGEFAGTSKEWQDRNTIKILGVDVPTPDVLSLEFRVTAPGISHRGPFFHLQPRISVPIILPVRPPVAKDSREIVQLITLSENTEKELYELLEDGARQTVAVIAGAYRRHDVLEESNATLANLRAKLEEVTDQSAVKAVDLVLNLHGLNEQMQLYPRVLLTADQVADELKKIPAAQRKKLRALFSTACFGASHLDEWLSVGFKVAAGSQGIYADSVLSLPAFLGSWSSGVGFGAAVAVANASDPLKLQEKIAREWFLGQNRRSEANQIDSTRKVRGNPALTINSLP